MLSDMGEAREQGVGPGSEGLRVFLAERDVACPNCGYNLRGLKGDTCPECSQRLVLSVALENPVSRAWLACILPLWISGGAFGLGGLIVLAVAGEQFVRDLRRGSNSEETFWFLIYPLVIAAVMLTAAVLLTRRRGRRWLAAKANRAPLVVTCIAAGAVPVLVWAGWLYAEVN